uniref:Uncharacterized protein n=1 Tax=Romanomermis culicivorax TaxID=13658 RepID=A0A915LAA2_ROMCU
MTIAYSGRNLGDSRETTSAFQESTSLDDVSSKKDDDDENDDSADRDCPSYRKLAEMIPWGDRGEKCCLDRSSPQNRKDICYTNKKDTPWQSLPQLPACPAEIDPQFLIFTPEDQESSKKKHAFEDNSTSQIIEYANLAQSLQNLAMSQNRQFFTIIHGFHTKSWDRNWMFTMKDVLIDLNLELTRFPKQKTLTVQCGDFLSVEPQEQTTWNYGF